MNEERVFAIASAKGGVGKTTTTLNLAAALAQEGVSAVVVEADLAMANVSDFLDLGIGRDDPTLHDVLAGRTSLKDATYDAPDGFAVLPSGTTLDGFAAADPGGLEEVIRSLRGHYGVVLVDTSAGICYGTTITLREADAIVLVSTPRLASVRDGRKTLELAERVETDVAGAIFVKSGSGMAPSPARISDFLSVPLLGHVPEDESVPAAQDIGRSVIKYDPAGAAATAYHRIANRFVEVVKQRRSEPMYRGGGRSPKPPYDLAQRFDHHRAIG